MDRKFVLLQYLLMFKQCNVSKNLLGKGSIFLFASILNASIPFLLLPILTRVLSPEDYGIIAMFAIYLSLVGAFVGLSVHGSINANYFKLSEEKFSEFVTSCLVLLMMSALSILIVVSFLGAFLEVLLGLPFKWLLIGVAISFFQFLINMQLTILMVKGEAVKYGTFQVSQTLLNALSSLFLILVVGLLWEGRLIGQAIAIVLFGALSLFILFKTQLVRKPKTLMLDIQDALKFGLPLIPHVIGGFAIQSSDRFILASKMDLAVVGIYMVALQLGQVMNLLSDSMNKVYSPWLMKNLESGQINKLELVKNSYLAMLGLLFIGVLWGITATFLLPILVGDKFNAAKDMVMIMCLAFAFTGLYYIVTNYIFFAKQTKELAQITFLCGCINIPLTYVLVDMYALMGAALAFLIVKIIFFGLVWYMSNKVYPMPWLFFLGKKNRN